MFQWEPLLAEIPWTNYRLQMELLCGPDSSSKSTGERTGGYLWILSHPTWASPDLEPSLVCRSQDIARKSEACTMYLLFQMQLCSAGYRRDPAILTRLSRFKNYQFLTSYVSTVKLLWLQASFGTHLPKLESWRFLCRSVTSLNSPELSVSWFPHFSVIVHLIKFSQTLHELMGIKLFKYST